MTVMVRDMTDGDREAVAAIRVGGRLHAYAGLLPQSHLDFMDAAADAARRHGDLAGAAGTVNVVAEQHGDVIGWACYGPSRAPDATADGCELYAIYVLPERISSGVGHALMAEVTGRARTRGFVRMELWVLKENARARRFYERAGFLPDGTEEPFEVDGTRVPEVRYTRRLV
ncbi:GNAT family N-acetyltransferase [Streptomyces genisteinicus]|uniref:GNAT family N-acetyltransferase n=1 Tax=Streptomyces genisteinicus TaxID=2768068 RepID=A0A7H0I0F7_9ACTN|nr:GNAT family N-acetyltransferase [Streptomyces genisteinicus]QNP66273.1 GNAT family N-acetyltransferase [Streptomyces genisteinicus]